MIKTYLQKLIIKESQKKNIYHKILRIIGNVYDIKYTPIMKKLVNKYILYSVCDEQQFSKRMVKYIHQKEQKANELSYTEIDLFIILKMYLIKNNMEY